MACTHSTTPRWLSTTGSCALAAACVAALLGAARSDRAAATTMAVVDLKYLFEHHAGFKEKAAELKTSVMLAEADINLQQQNVQQLQQKLAAANAKEEVNREETKALEAEIAMATADLQAQVAVQRSDFLHREAAIYSETYREITAEINKYRLEHGIDVVFRFNPSELKGTESPEEVTRMLNKPIVAHEAGMNITMAIHERLNRAQDEQPAE